MKTIKQGKSLLLMLMCIIAASLMSSCQNSDAYNPPVPGPGPNPVPGKSIRFNTGQKFAEIMIAHSTVVNLSSGKQFSFAIKGGDWIVPADKQKSTYDKGDSIKIEFKVSAIEPNVERSALILFTTLDKKETDTISVSQSGIIKVKTPGTLAQEIKRQGLDSMKVEKMVIEGTLNSPDVLCLRQMTGGGKTKDEITKGKLADLDISKVKFIKDERPFFISDYSPSEISIDGADSVPNFMFAYCPALKSITLPTSVSTIGVYALANSSSLSKINIPDNITSLGYGCFSGDDALLKIKLPESITSLAGGVFANCHKLESVNIPENITKLEFALFNGCESLKSIRIPENIKSIAYAAFEGCKGLKDITIDVLKPNDVEITSSAFDEDNTATLHVPLNKVKAYINSEFNKYFSGRITQ